MDTPTATLTTTETDEERVPAPGSAETDREILITLYNTLDGPNWEESENWLSDAPLGEWSGVRTDDNGRVTMIFLGGSNSGQPLRREIPPELAGLGALTHLGLSGLDSLGQGRQFRGEIPPELGNPR
jgi:hypothetical protein